MLNIVLFGPPGSGKGTQSEKIIEKYGLVHLSTGDLFRKHLNDGTELGKLAQSFMDNGNLVPDQVVINMVKDKITTTIDPKGFIFDGFPRTVRQAQFLDDMLSDLNTPVSGMVALDVPNEVLKKRLLKRGKTSGRTDDQIEEKINIRINVYKEETIPVLQYYQKQKKFNSINGVGSIEEIFNTIKVIINRFLN